MATPITNFGLVTVSTGYSSAATSVVLSSGDGSKLPSTFPYPLTWWNATDYPHPADDPNREIVLVTARSSDTLTVARAQENTSASNKNSAGKSYRMSLGITKTMWDSLRAPTQTVRGLQLQTHRDADLASTQVEIVDVDSIIMDDGVELRNDNGEWSGKSASITGSGAGGLDSGSEATSTWYEIYAIAKEDGTRNLLLHQSKQWTIDTGWSIGEDASQGIRSAVDNSTVKVAQGIRLGNSGKVVYLQVKLLKVGTPTGKIWFTIESDNAGKPSGTALATSEAYDVARLPATSIRLRIPMKSSQALSQTPTQYHLVAQGSWAVSATNYVAWRMDGSAGAYAGGSKALFDSDTSTWTTDPDDDMMFEIGTETNNNALILPSGYTKQCFLGWVFNDGAGNFVPFLQIQQARRMSNITATNCIAWSTGGTAELIDLLQFLPPRRLIKAIVAFTGTGTSAGLIAIGDLRASDISSIGDTTGAQTVILAGTTTTRPSEFKEVFVQSVGLMAMGTFTGKLWVVGFEW